MTDNLTDLAARAEALSTDVAAARRERDSLRAELAACRAERDQLRLRLDTERDRLRRELAVDRAGLQSQLDSERGRVASALESRSVEASQHAYRAAVAEREAERLAAELTATRATLSWRVTRPLRAIRRAFLRRA